MDLEALKTFIAVARQKSFSAVARLQGVEPSSVSRLIGALEHELGERLFQRTTRRLTLTEAGTAYLARIEPLLAQIEEATEEVRALGRGPVGTIRLSTSVALGLDLIVPLLGRFKAEFPALKVELVMSDDFLDLVGEGVDLAIRLAPSVEANVIASKLFDTRYHVVAAPAWLAAHPLSQPTDLANHRVLRFAQPGYRDRWLFAQPGKDPIAVAIDGDILVSSPAALKEAAIMGLGPALLADWSIRSTMLQGDLVDCFPDWSVTATDFSTGAWLIYPSRKFLPNKVRATIDFLRRHLSTPSLSQ
ncbi:MAG: LysR family transcriptional regulator [Ralstonia sp.]|uniref:LysR family transcriptional regulator n=1 Tax=Ralstonia sp. TaxID=54061 RepID=UPI00257ECADD|nr:LysR family transcriptional regulator [Ralstonia sp.]MBA4165212.1 LysR family transcriptional regulator [Erythrobacter sp.]MBA4233860.1 LysR family transcriptional regulator [Ralstonia sp.]